MQSNCGVARSGQGSDWWIKQRREGELKEQKICFAILVTLSCPLPRLSKITYIKPQISLHACPIQPLTELHYATDLLKLKEKMMIRCAAMHTQTAPRSDCRVTE